MTKQHLHDNPDRTTPVGLARYAHDFYDAALAADDKLGMKKGYEIIAPIPVMFLVGQALELALKAYLLSRGVPLRKLRSKYGHDLHRALRKAKELGLLEIVDLSDEDESTVKLLNTLYSSKQLQYIVTGSKRFPVFGPLQEVAEKIIPGISEEVGYAYRRC